MPVITKPSLFFIETEATKKNKIDSLSKELYIYLKSEYREEERNDYRALCYNIV